MAQSLSTYDHLRRQLRPLGLRLRFGDTLLVASRSLWLAAAATTLVALAGRLLPIAHLRLWAAAPLLLWLLGVIGYALFRPMPPARVARRVDQLLGLRERLATALELHDRDAHDLLSERQQEDAGALARTLTAGQLPLRVDRQPLLWAIPPLILSALLLFVLPNPQDQALAQRQAVQAALAESADQLAELERQIGEETQLSAEDRERLLKELQALQEQLRRNPGDPQEALADLSAAEARLRQNLDPNSDARRAALEQLARNLETLSGRQPGQRPDVEQAANQLDQLARQLDQRSPAERQQLAEQLAQQAAQTAASDPATAQRLQNATNALRQGDTQQAAAQLQQAAESVREAQSSLANQQRTQQSLSELQGAREQIAQAGQQQGQQGQAQQSQGQQGQTQQGQGQTQQGQAQQGQGQGQQGQAQQPGSGGGTNAPNLGQGQSNNSSNVDPNRPAGQQGSGTGSDGLVYQPYRPAGQQGTPDFVQGQQGQGGSSQTQTGQDTLPGVSNPSMVPYQQVFPEYAEAASEALDRGYIPPHLKEFVRDYFSRLEPGTVP
mgnify:CR=1 FL=1